MQRISEIEIDKLQLGVYRTGKRLSEIYLSHVDHPERMHQRLIIIVDIPHATERQLGLIEPIISRAVKAFEGARHVTPELVLESILESLNISLPDLVPKKLSEILGQVNILIALSDRGQVHFSYIGDIKALLIQENSVTLLTERQEELNVFKLFSFITSGVLNPGDALIFTTDTLLDYVAETKIHNLLRELPPGIAVRHLEDLLKRVPSSVSFTSVFIKFRTERDVLAERRFAESHGRHPQTEPAREEMLPEPDAYLPKYRQSAERIKYGRIVQASGATTSVLRSGIQYFSSGAITYVLLLLKVFWAALSAAQTGLLAIVLSSRRRSAEDQIRTFTQTLIHSIKSRLRPLSKVARFLLAVIFILTLVLMQYLITRSQDVERIKAQKAYDDAIHLAGLMKREAENARIYNDERRAEQLLLEVGRILDEMQPRTQNDEREIQAYREENSRLLNKIRKLNIIQSPMVFARLDSLTEGDISQIAFVGDRLYASSGAQIFAFNNEAPQLYASSPRSIRHLVTFPDQEMLYIVTDDNVLSRIAEGNIQPVNLPLHADSDNIDAINTYGSNIYILDTTNKTIYRNNGGNSTFQRGTTWSKETLSLSGANDFAIDGNIYAVRKDGNIIKFTRGERQDFSMAPLTPHLGERTKLFTTRTSPYLYILDRDNNRVVIIAKNNGSIVDQYVSNTFDNLTSLTVNPKEDILLVTNGFTIYQIRINKPGP